MPSACRAPPSRCTSTNALRNQRRPEGFGVRESGAPSSVHMATVDPDASNNFTLRTGTPVAGDTQRTVVMTVQGWAASSVTFSSEHRYFAGSPVTADALPIHLSCGNSSAHGTRRSPPLKVPPVGLRSTLRAEKCSMNSVTNPVEKAAVERYPDGVHVTGDEYDRIHPWNRPKVHQIIVGLAQNATASVGMDCPRRPAVRPPSSH